MKVYFTASARGLATYRQNYQAIFNSVQDLGHINLDDLVLKLTPDEFLTENHAEQVKLYEKTLKFIKEADIVLLEISDHSIAMGFVMQKAIELGKPVVALYTAGHYPYFVGGIENDKFQLIEYEPDKVKSVLRSAFEYAQEKVDTRFNFFISPRHIHYMDWIAKNKRIPRSVYLRDLIERDMLKNDEYTQ